MGQEGENGGISVGVDVNVNESTGLSTHQLQMQKLLVPSALVLYWPEIILILNSSFSILPPTLLLK